MTIFDQIRRENSNISNFLPLKISQFLHKSKNWPFFKLFKNLNFLHQKRIIDTLCNGQLKTFFYMNLNGSEKSGGGPSPLGEIARREIKETNILNGGS